MNILSHLPKGLLDYSNYAPKHLCVAVATWLVKKYSIIDQQIVRHFVHYCECLFHPLPFSATQTTNPFLTSKISANHVKGLGS